MPDEARYIIGIDLGTTNSSVAYVDTDRSKNPSQGVRPFPIPQLTSTGVFEQRSSLASYMFLADGANEDFSNALPWTKGRDFSVGHHAREHGARSPTRCVLSAKSWLCNGTASRRDPILPIECFLPERRQSPVAASAAYLAHIRSAWNHVMARHDPEADFDSQDIILTVPASFDEVARTLTVEAAKQAGFRTMTLLEEPQAAFYSWIWRHEAQWEQKLTAGQSILVCDVGGGTSDFSLIRVEEAEGKLAFQRHAVGRHLLLGGDNLDLAVTQVLESKLLAADETPLDSQQYLQLRHLARVAKEELLADDGHEEFRALLQGGGSSVVAGSRATTISKKELRNLLLEGFFGCYSSDDAREIQSGSAVQSLGLPYEAEPSVSKHLAAFLNSAGSQMGEALAPDYLLFNGGTMKPAIFQERIAQSLKQWTGKEPELLASQSLDLAVGQGAAYFGRARRGLGVRIAGGLPRAYYLKCEVDGEGPQALTLLARGTELGTEYVSERAFEVLPNQTVSFQLLSSLVRLGDEVGELVAIMEEEMQLLPSIHTVLRFGKGGKTRGALPVRLGISLSEIGTLEIWLDAVESEHRWNLEFQLQSAGGGEDSLSAGSTGRLDETFTSSHLEPALKILERAFGKERTLKPGEVMIVLEEALGEKRTAWSPSVLRGLWDGLIEYAPRRNVSSAYAARWWNLLGYLLRPGYGFPADDFRIQSLWKVLLSEKNARDADEVALQKWICLRRLAGGFNRGQQAQLIGQVLPLFLSKKGRIQLKAGKKEIYAYQEQLRCAGAMELMDLGLKAKLGKALLLRLQDLEGSAAEYWTLARLGARHLLHGGIAHVLPREQCEDWLRLLQPQMKRIGDLEFLLQQWVRQTDQRELNVSKEVALEVIQRCVPGRKISLSAEVRDSSSLMSQHEEERLFGDSLPSGLRLVEA